MRYTCSNLSGLLTMVKYSGYRYFVVLQQNIGLNLSIRRADSRLVPSVRALRVRVYRPRR